MTDAQAPPRSGGEAIFREAKGAHETGRQLLPLLSLLEETDRPSSLDELKELLSTIVTILGQHTTSLIEIRSRLDVVRPFPNE